jgi:hypothetical protein
MSGKCLHRATTDEGGLMKMFGRILAVGILAIFITGIALTADQDGRDKVSRVVRDAGEEILAQPVAPVNSGDDSRARYDCDLRVFMVEQESRWKDSQQKRYGNGFISFAFDTSLSLAYQETYQETKVYDLGITGFVINNPDSIWVNQYNMKAIAVVYNAESGGTGISDPYYDHPQGSPFTIHTGDACAAATDGNPGSNIAVGNSTHTVFIEEGTSHT